MNLRLPMPIVIRPSTTGSRLPQRQNITHPSVGLALAAIAECSDPVANRGKADSAEPWEYVAIDPERTFPARPCCIAVSAARSYDPTASKPFTGCSVHAHRQTAHGRRPQSPDPKSTSDKGIDQFVFFFSGRNGVGYYASDKTLPSRGSRGRPSRALAALSRQCVEICARSRVPYVCEFLQRLYGVGPVYAAL